MKPPCKRHELAGLTDECFCPEPVYDPEQVVKWTYELRWGHTVAVCTVSYQGRVEQWAAKSIYITEQERYDVPKLLLDKIKATIRMFGPVVEDYPS